jgi:alpha-galactosidase
MNFTLTYRKLTFTRMLGLFVWIAAQTGNFLVAADADRPDVPGWAASAFAGAPAASPRPVTALVVRRQDYGTLGINRSVMGARLSIGQNEFAHGLGSHANSEIVVSFPAGTAHTFNAMVGIDCESGTAGSVQFLVEIGGTNVFHSPTLRGGQEAMPVHIEIPSGVDRMVLKVDTTPDGPSSDHADWGSAQLVLTDGSVVWLDELASKSGGDFWPSASPPFSFVYNGASSETFLSSWKREVQTNDLPDRTVYQSQWADSETGLKVSALATVFKDFPAVEWLLRFENSGTEDTPILENIQALDVTLKMDPAHDLTLDQIGGDDDTERTFAPLERDLGPRQNIMLAPTGGRSSSGTFPMFNLQEGARGFFTAIGWTGQWAASLERNKDGATRLKAGMELTHLLLHPGESIRTPRILLLPWSGDRVEAHNQFRRLLTAHYLPKVDGQPVQFAFAAQTFNTAPPNWGTEAGQLACAKINRDLGCDTLWMDAGWFKGNFPSGTGNWIPKAKEFPNGLAPIGEACEKLGLKFLVWYEPERVSDHTEIALDHTEFVLPVNKPHGGGGLFNLGDPIARRWLTDLLIQQIIDFHIHTYRNDFNMDPLSFWRQNDPTNRQGMTEIRYVEGLYTMWDELRAKFPHMYIDNCASGGRRIDLEMITRSVVQTRSDAAVSPGRADWNQSQTYGLNLFLPVHATIGWEIGAYECRSAATAGFCAEWNILDEKFPFARAKTYIHEMTENRKYWSGDYYPLTSWTVAPDRWMAWQMHRADLDEGIVLAFRHQQCPYSAMQVSLRAIKPDQTYLVHFIDEQNHFIAQTMPGRQLATLELKIRAPHQSLLVRYAPEKNP